MQISRVSSLKPPDFTEHSDRRSLGRHDSDVTYLDPDQQLLQTGSSKNTGSCNGNHGEYSADGGQNSTLPKLEVETAEEDSWSRCDRSEDVKSKELCVDESPERNYSEEDCCLDSNHFRPSCTPLHSSLSKASDNHVDAMSTPDGTQLVSNYSGLFVTSHFSWSTVWLLTFRFWVEAVRTDFNIYPEVKRSRLCFGVCRFLSAGFLQNYEQIFILSYNGLALGIALGKSS